MTDWDSVTIDLRRTTYPTPVNVVDGVPQCPCHHEPMTERDAGVWMCVVGAAMLDYIAAAVPAEWRPDVADLT